MSRNRFDTNRYNLPPSGRHSRYIDVHKRDANPGTMRLDYYKNDSPKTHGSYGVLILHPNWKAKRIEVLERDQFKCVVCKNESELQIHHRQYHFVKLENRFKDPWDYPNHLLITLCSKCHARGHSKFKVPSINI